MTTLGGVRISSMVRHSSARRRASHGSVGPFETATEGDEMRLFEMMSTGVETIGLGESTEVAAGRMRQHAVQQRQHGRARP